MRTILTKLLGLYTPCCEKLLFLVSAYFTVGADVGKCDNWNSVKTNEFWNSLVMEMEQTWLKTKTWILITSMCKWYINSSRLSTSNSVTHNPALSLEILKNSKAKNKKIYKLKKFLLSVHTKRVSIISEWFSYLCLAHQFTYSETVKIGCISLESHVIIKYFPTLLCLRMEPAAAGWDRDRRLFNGQKPLSNVGTLCLQPDSGDGIFPCHLDAFQVD